MIPLKKITAFVASKRYSAKSPIRKQISIYNLLIRNPNYYDFIAFLSGKIALWAGNSKCSTIMINQRISKRIADINKRASCLFRYLPDRKKTFYGIFEFKSIERLPEKIPCA